MAISYSSLTSPIKSIQRGEAVSSGSITITTVDITKTFVRSYSEGSAGTVATNSTVAATSGTSSGTLSPSGGSVANTSGGGAAGGGSFPSYSGTRTISMGSAAISGGTTSLTTAEYGVYLSNSTTLVASGPCRWEVVEYN